MHTEHRFSDTQSSSRVDWIDVARGMAIVLVVLTHSVSSGLQLGDVNSTLIFVNSEILYEIRMPLFFFCSGLLAFWGLQKPGSVILHRRIFALIWIILIWTGIHFFAAQFVNLYPWNEGIYRLYRILWSPFGILWFIYAILIVTIVMWILRNLPIAVQIISVLLLCALVKLVVVGRFPQFPNNSFVAEISDYALLCFAGGYWLAPSVMMYLQSTRRSAVLFVCAVSMWLVMDWVTSSSVQQPFDLPRILTCLPALAVGLSAARLLIHISWIRMPFQTLGSRTLEIFMIHQFFVATTFAVLERVGFVHPTASVMVIFACARAGSIALQRLISRAEFQVLFRPPRIRRKPQVV